MDRSRRKFLINVGLAVPATALSTSLAHAENFACRDIETLPAIIRRPGSYCLRRDFQLAKESSIALRILADNVTVDLNGHEISNMAASDSNISIGIGIASGAGVTVRNGTLRGFYAGVYCWACDCPEGRHLIEHLRILQTTALGIGATGGQTIIRHNHIGGLGGRYAVGYASGALGIGLFDSAYSLVSENDIEGFCPHNEDPTVTGIFLSDACSNMIVQANRISNLRYGIVFDKTGGASGKYRHNVHSNVLKNYTHGTAVGTPNT